MSDGKKNGRWEIFYKDGKPWNITIYKNDKNIKAIVIDKEIADIKLIKLPIFKFSETENIGNFILEYFKR